MRKMFLLCVCLGVVFSAVACLAGDDGSLKIVMTGNSMGKYRACPTCGRYAVGGLDRRKAVFDSIREEGGAALFISSGYDLASYIRKDKLPPKAFSPMVKAYNILGYDLGVATALEGKAFDAAGESLPQSFMRVANKPISRVISLAGTSVGCVVFPEMPLFDEVSPAMMASVAAEAKALRAKVDVVLGISSWGERNEQRLLKNHGQIFQVLAGSGPGTGFGLRKIPESKTLWVRPEFEGRSVSVLNVFKMKEKKSVLGFDKSEYDYKKISLDQTVRGNARVSALFGWL